MALAHSARPHGNGSTPDHRSRARNANARVAASTSPGVRSLRKAFPAPKFQHISRNVQEVVSGLSMLNANPGTRSAPDASVTTVSKLVSWGPPSPGSPADDQ